VSESSLEQRGRGAAMMMTSETVPFRPARGGEFPSTAALPFGQLVIADRLDEGSLDAYSRLLRARIIFLGSEIDDQLANVIVAQLLFLEAEDAAEDISLYINSPGGAAYAGL